jgi:hypothetical protein
MCGTIFNNVSFNTLWKKCCCYLLFIAMRFLNKKIKYIKQSLKKKNILFKKEK